MRRYFLTILGLSLAAAFSPRGLFAAAPGGASAAPAKSATKATDLFPDTVVARGKGVEVKRSQLETRVARLKTQAAVRGQPISSDRAVEVDQYVLNQLIQNQLLLATASEADKTAAKTLGQQRFEETKTQLGSDEALDRQLKLADTTREELLKELTDGAAVETLIKRVLKVNITDEDVKKYYEDNPSRFEQPEMVRASHILLATQDLKTREELSAEKKAAQHKLAEDLLKRARGGEDFAKLAKEYSEDSGSKDRGGEYTFPRNQMVKEFEAAAFALNTNQISEIVTTQFGYHIIKVSEKIPARKASLDDEVIFAPAGYVVIKKYWNGAPEMVRSAAKVSTLIRQKLETEQLQKQIPAYVDKLRKEANVEILDEKLKPKETADATQPATGRAPVPTSNKSSVK